MAMTKRPRMIEQIFQILSKRKLFQLKNASTRLQDNDPPPLPPLPTTHDVKI